MSKKPFSILTIKTTANSIMNSKMKYVSHAANGMAIVTRTIAMMTTAKFLDEVTAAMKVAEKASAELGYADIPMIQRAAMQVASTLNLSTSPNQAVVGTGSSPNGDLLNGLLQGMAAMNGMPGEEGQDIVLQIDGQDFARLIMPKLTKEYKRNGVTLQEE